MLGFQQIVLLTSSLSQWVELTILDLYIFICFTKVDHYNLVLGERSKEWWQGLLFQEDFSDSLLLTSVNTNELSCRAMHSSVTVCGSRFRTLRMTSIQMASIQMASIHRRNSFLWFRPWFHNHCYILNDSLYNAGTPLVLVSLLLPTMPATCCLLSTVCLKDSRSSHCDSRTEPPNQVLPSTTIIFCLISFWYLFGIFGNSTVESSIATVVPNNLSFYHQTTTTSPLERTIHNSHSLNPFYSIPFHSTLFHTTLLHSTQSFQSW